MFRIPLYNVLRLVPTFKDSFNELMLKRKLILLVADINTDLSQISLEVYEYDSDSDIAFPPKPST